MLWTPDILNENEILDDPSVDIEVRKKLMLELDRTNLKYGTYAQFCRHFFVWLERLNLKNKNISILEIGSGSGGLAREILKNVNGPWNIGYSLMDLDSNILNWAQGRLQEQGLSCKTFLSTDEHLSQFLDDTFDIVISLHVIHHIHPVSQVRSMFQNVYRISRVGFFMADFERRFGNVVMAKVVNTLSGLSKELNSDGVKSVKRAYTSSEIEDCLKPTPKNFNVKVAPLFPFPHMIITGNVNLETGLKNKNS